MVVVMVMVMVVNCNECGGVTLHSIAFTHPIAFATGVYLNNIQCNSAKGLG